MAGPQVPAIDSVRQTRSQAFQAPMASAEAFGASKARAMQGVGQAISQVGDTASAIGLQEKQTKMANGVLDAGNALADRYRTKLYDPDSGIFSQSGSKAMGAGADFDKFSADVFAEVSAGLKSPEEQAAFKRLADRQREATMDAVARHEQKETITYKGETVKATLEGAAADYAGGIGNDKLMMESRQRVRDAIVANNQGLPVEAINVQLRQADSALAVSAVQRLAIDDPIAADKWYQSHKDMVDGPDHVKIADMLRAPLRRAKVSSTFQQIIGGSAPANRLLRAMTGAESNYGQDTRTSAAGAAGPLQVVPGTAREISAALGDHALDGLDDKGVQDAMKANGGRLGFLYGARYMQQQLNAYGGDLEASLIAYNAGPANANKWLNSGRDYSVLPKREETEPYVRRIMGEYAGKERVSVKTDYGEAQIEGSDDFLLKRLSKDKDESDVRNMKPALKVGLAQMMAAAPPGIREGLGIFSGTRSPERQAQIIAGSMGKYGMGEKAAAWQADVKSMGPKAAGAKWRPQFKAAGLSANIGMPGGSKHQHGEAADLSYNGASLKNAPKEVVNWVHQNAARYGLTFPMAHENWHVEPIGARGGSGRTIENGEAIAAVASDAAQSYSVPMTDGGGAYTPGSGIADAIGFGAKDAGDGAGVVVSTGAAISVPTAGNDGATLQDWIDQADASDLDPEEQASMRAKLTAEWNRRERAGKESTREIFSNAMKAVRGGDPVTSLTSDVLDQLSGDQLMKLDRVEAAIAKDGEPKTDWKTYADISAMPDDQLKGVDVYETYGDKLAHSELEKVLTRQRAAMGDDEKARSDIAGLRSRADIQRSAFQLMGIKPQDGGTDAETAGLFERQLDDRIVAFQQETGKAPRADDVQKMVDRMMIEGKDVSGFGEEGGRLFQMTPDKVNNFYAAGNVSDVPAPLLQKMGEKFFREEGRKLDETEAVDLYNRSIQAANGGSVPIPDKDKAEFSAAMAQSLGRPLQGSGALGIDELTRLYNRHLSSYVGM